MAKTAVLVRLSPGANAALRKLAAREGRTISNMAETLIANALDDPDGYYLRLAAHQSWLGAMLALNQLHASLGQEECARRVGGIVEQSKKLFGEPPRIPNDHFDGTEPNPVIAAMLELGGVRPPASP